MSSVNREQFAAVKSSETINFADRLARSEAFERVFQEGMALVERTAAYLEKEGRAEARRLLPPVSTAYATESMRLTTRLLALASWLLIRRAVNSGELSENEAAAKRARLKLSGTGRPSHIAQFDALPQELRNLIVESFRLNDRIAQFDKVFAVGNADAVNPVAQQLMTLESAFANRSGSLFNRLPVN